MNRSSSSQPSTRAIYFVHGSGELDKRELDSHPEVKITDSFNTLKAYSQIPVALWIDKTVLSDPSYLDKGWFELSPQTYYPIVVVGFGEKEAALDAISGLGLCCDFVSPRADPGLPGFSVLNHDKGHPGTNNFWKGYVTDKVHVEDILNVTNSLLDGTLPPETVPLPPVDTPTLPV